MDKFLWKFYWDCGRQGDLESLIVATDDEIKSLMGKYANFGEVLGKHSEIYGKLEDHDFTKLNLSTDVVDQVSDILGNVWSGHNPFEFVQYDCSICGCTYPAYEYDLEHEMCDYCYRAKNESHN